MCVAIHTGVTVFAIVSQDRPGRSQQTVSQQNQPLRQPLCFPCGSLKIVACVATHLRTEGRYCSPRNEGNGSEGSEN